MDWQGNRFYPRPDWLSSSRKRLAPQLIYKGGILNQWGKKMAIAVQTSFYKTLPALPEVDPAEADIAWLLYDLRYDQASDRYHLTRDRVVYCRFRPTLERITTAEFGPIEGFVQVLQDKLNEKLANGQ